MKKRKTSKLTVDLINLITEKKEFKESTMYCSGNFLNLLEKACEKISIYYYHPKGIYCTSCDRQLPYKGFKTKDGCKWCDGGKK